jgi:hypothetical protein
MDYGPEPSSRDCVLQYYYYIPCPTYSWFWAYSGWEPGDIIGAHFRIADQGTGGFDPADPWGCCHLGWIGILDFAGYGTAYPGLFTIEMDVYCADDTPSPRSHMWNSGSLETHFGWNYVEVEPPLYILPCWDYDRWPPAAPAIVVTMTSTGSEGIFPKLGFDNISTSIHVGCPLHDLGCLPAAYPRTRMGESDLSVHSGYIGKYPFQNWPPLPFPDGVHTGFRPFGWCGYVELAMQIGMPFWHMRSEKALYQTSWGAIKSLYR